MTVNRWIDPEIAAILDGMPPVVGVLNDETLPGLRQERGQAMAQLQLSDQVERTDYPVPGADGEPDVVVRFHRPVGVETPAACVYSIHGGGYVFGTAQTEDPRLEQLTLEVGCMAASVEYRLSPDVHYPRSLEDCYAGLIWLHDHAEKLGIDPQRIGITGTSAGGGLAAALAILARDRGGPHIAFQLLVYPMIDDRAVTASSSWQVPVWDPVLNEYGWRSYLGPLYGAADVPVTAAPARATDLSGLPPTYLYVGSADVFMDEDIDYAQRLSHAGVPTEFHVYAGAVHGFEGIAVSAGISRKARADATEWIRKMTAKR